MNVATEEGEEENATFFNKRLNKLLNKARLQDSMFGIPLMATDS